MAPRIAIVGTGAVGGYVGAHLVKGGHDVTFIDMWPENVEAMRTKGLRVKHLKDVPEFTVKVRALHITDVQGLINEAPIDIAFVCVKSYDTAWATMMIKQYLAPDGYVVSLQNCINEPVVASVVGEDRTLGSIASSITVELTGPGEVFRAAGKSGDGHTVFRVGQPNGKITERVKQVRDLVALSDSAKVTDNLMGERWTKLVINGMGNGMSASHRHEVAQLDRQRTAPPFHGEARQRDRPHRQGQGTAARRDLSSRSRRDFARRHRRPQRAAGL